MRRRPSPGGSAPVGTRTWTASRFRGSERPRSLNRLVLSATGRRERLAAEGARILAINGQPGALLLEPGGRAVVVIPLDIADDQVQTLPVVSNPDKLGHLSVEVAEPS